MSQEHLKQMNGMHERFDERFNNVSKTVVTIETLEGFNEQKPASDELKSFIESEIQLALAERDKQIVEGIKELRHELGQEESLDGDIERWKEGHTKCLDEVLSLISKNK